MLFLEWWGLSFLSLHVTTLRRVDKKPYSLKAEALIRSFLVLLASKEKLVSLVWEEGRWVVMDLRGEAKEPRVIQSSWGQMVSWKVAACGNYKCWSLGLSLAEV